DLGEPESLRRSHDTGDDIVLGVLVRPKVQFRLHRFRGCGLELLFERLSVCNHFAIPVNSAARVDIDLHDLGQDERRRRIAYGEVEIDGVQLDGNGDDEHYQQNQHYIDQRGGVDVDHDIGIARSAA